MAVLTVCLNPTLQKTLYYSSVICGTVNRTAVHRLDASGKGVNAARVLTQLGKRAVHLTQLGGVMRPLFLSLCEQDGLSVEWVESKSQIRFCYTILESDGKSKDSVTELVEESEPVSAGTEELLLKKYASLLDKQVFSCLVVSGTKAAGFSNTAIPQMVCGAKEKGLKVILDIKGKDLSECLQYKPDIIKPNLFEFADTFAPEMVKNNNFIEENPAAAEKIKNTALEIYKKYGCRIILTDGSRMIRAVDDDGFFQTDIKTVKAVNTTGCGDAFTAGLACAVEDGADFRRAIAEGIRCGALNAAYIKPGVILAPSA